MQPDKEPRFSHVAIGGQEMPAWTDEGEEEVTTVGVLPHGEAVGGHEEQDDTPVNAAYATVEEGPSSPQDAVVANKDPDYSLDDLQPMALPQKIVIGACVVGVILIAAYVLDYWEVISFPF